MSRNTTTIDAFLEPWSEPDAGELRHIVANSWRRADTGGRYEELGRIEPWHGFNYSRISSSAILAPCLRTKFERQWQAWVPDVARVIRNERQLEYLYGQTFIPRVNIALQGALPPDQPSLTIIVCPGSFDSYDPDHTDGKETVILPDWVVIEGSYSPTDLEIPTLEDLASQYKILAVGDTKLSRQSYGEEHSAEGAVVPGTYSCLNGDLAQLQHYARMLRTRFGFILSNKELVVAQFLREEGATPRQLRQLGLRSLTRPDRLHHGVPSDFNTSDTWVHGAGNDSDEEDGASLPTPLQVRKRKHEENSPHAITPQRALPMVASPSNRSQPGQFASSPPQPKFPRHIPFSSPSAPSLTSHLHPSNISPSPSRNSLVPSSSPYKTAEEQEAILPSSTSYAPSERSYEVGRVLVQNFKIPNSLDGSNGVEKLRKPGQMVDMPEQASDGTPKIHPCKALFSLLMLARSAGSEGRRIDIEAVEF